MGRHSQETGDLSAGTLDAQHLSKLRANITTFLEHCAKEYANKPGKILDVGSDRADISKVFPGCEVQTLDHNPEVKDHVNYFSDICVEDPLLETESFDYVACIEVLEHTHTPQAAVNQIKRILKKGGFVFITVPFNFCIHCSTDEFWRFTENGLRLLFRDFKIIELNKLETPGRKAFPIHYTLVAKKRSKNAGKD